MHALPLRSLRCATIVASALLAASCRTNPVASPSVDATGRYSLVSVDGNPLPARISHEGASLEVLSGAFDIETGGACSSRTVFIAPNGAEVTREVDATYTQRGATLRMHWNGAGTTVGTVDGSTFTMDNEGMLFVYRK